MKFTDQSSAWLRAILQRNKRLIVLTTGLVVLTQFGDAVLPTLVHVLHLLIEVIELPLEHLLEWTLHLSPRQSQGVLAWSALILVVYLAIRFVRNAYLELQRAIQAAADSVQALKKTARPTLLSHPAAAITLTVGVLSAVLFVFT